MAQKKNILQNIILGLLSQKSMTGYDLSQSFQHEIGEFWQANHSQIYPLLTKMETNGLIDHTDEIAGQKLARKRYFLTDLGTKTLEDWISSPTPNERTTKDEFILKLYFIKSKNDPRIPIMISEQLNNHSKWLEHLNERKQELFDTQTKINDQYGHFLILDHAIKREQNYVDWLQIQLKTI